METCSLCRIAKGRAGGARMYEDDSLVVVLVMQTGQAGYVLVIPKAHEPTLEALGMALEAHLFKTSLRATESLGDAGLDFRGMDLQVVQQSDAHVHLRVSPMTN